MGSRAQQHLSFSTQLAAQIGVEEAILHAVLDAMNTHKINLVQEAVLLQKLPWLNASNLHVLLGRLRVERLINFHPSREEQYEFELLSQDDNQSKMPAVECAAENVKPYPLPSYQQKHCMQPDWQPPAGSLDYLNTIGQASDYLDESLSEFRAYYAATGEQLLPSTWVKKFQTWVIKKKRDSEAQTEKQKHTFNLTMDWAPEADYVHQLTETGVEPKFISETLPEFRAYWSERQEPRDNWNYMFQKYVRVQWARLQENKRNGCAPMSMPENWEPGKLCMDIIHNSLIDEQFAQDLISEFKLYWIQRGEERAAWDAVFLRWCKLCWSQRKKDGLHQKLRDQNYMDRLLDTDW